MADLIAQGPKPRDSWRRPLPADGPVVLGRDTGAWDVPWEPFLSRRHAELQWAEGRLEVRQLPTARNPLFLKGQESAHFAVKPGEHFVLGSTTFTVLAAGSHTPADRPAQYEATVSAPDLEKRQFRDAPHRLDVLSRLPELISGAADDAELFLRLANMLLAGVPRADLVALVRVAAAPSGGTQVDVLHWERRLVGGGDFRPSERLVLEAVGHRQQTVLHAWAATPDAGASPEFTAAGNCDWAFCTPVRGEACPGWAIYVAGRFGADSAGTLGGPLETSDLADDLKFTELAAAVLNSLRQVRALQRRQASLSPFFSPAVLRTLTDKDPEAALQPQETDLTILFCDLRGFSRESEKHAENLLALLNRVSQALGLMTQNILDQKGVIGDFHGDAAMGFWGWPIPQADAAERACHAALGIRTVFEAIGRKPEHPLAGFQVGIGIASGRGVAGKIGTVNQVKVTVFGPVVNLASRLEGMTKILRAPILLDEATAEVIRERAPRDMARLRRVARVKPYGLDTPLVVTELLPPLAEYPVLTDKHLVDYERAVDALLAGDWARAYDFLRRMPPEDRVPDFLTVLIAKHDRKPPPGWQGVIEMETKS
jgi:adenylate cyclase